jgi:hypothetical protein
LVESKNLINVIDYETKNNNKDQRFDGVIGIVADPLFTRQ